MGWFLGRTTFDSRLEILVEFLDSSLQPGLHFQISSRVAKQLSGFLLVFLHGDLLSYMSIGVALPEPAFKPVLTFMFGSFR